MKYTKKPVTINAVLWKDGKISETPDWIKNALAMNINSETGAIMRIGKEVHIRTLEGIMTASDGDYIIQGVKGELYPCKPDIFALTYVEFSKSSNGELTDELIEEEAKKYGCKTNN